MCSKKIVCTELFLSDATNKRVIHLIACLLIACVLVVWGLALCALIVRQVLIVCVCAQCGLSRRVCGVCVCALIAGVFVLVLTGRLNCLACRLCALLFMVLFARGLHSLHRCGHAIARHRTRLALTTGF